MYTKRIQIIDYGPISHIDIEFPFHHDIPKPILLVGENGSGKSIFLSHIVNGLVSAKGRAYPETPEVETGKVFKLRSPLYIRAHSDWCFAKVDFEGDLWTGELTIARPKRDYAENPPDFSTISDAQLAWDQMDSDGNSRLISNIHADSDIVIRELFSKNCVLFFPHNRFEEPAWLNEENLKTQAEHMNIPHLRNYTNRKLISYSSLRTNQDWLFGVAYDRVVPMWAGLFDHAASANSIALDLLRCILREPDLDLGFGRRRSRVVTLVQNGSLLLPNIFQLSSGETSLLNLFISILRDFDLSGASFSNASEVRGIVVIDEIDLHLHAIHQHAILPRLIKMFPKVQFVVSTHSPLFILGMRKFFGEEGFAIYRLPDGQQISPEAFSEFSDAYEAFALTSRFADDMRLAVQNAQHPVVYVEGKTDVMYLRKAAELLGRNALLQNVELLEVGGEKLKNIWSATATLPERLTSKPIVVMFDCDYTGKMENNGQKYKRKMPHMNQHPIAKGIENLFNKETLEKARSHNSAFIDINEAHNMIERGEAKAILEEWKVNRDEKTNLCNWLCENGTVEDFRHFEAVFDMFDELLHRQCR